MLTLPPLHAVELLSDAILSGPTTAPLAIDHIDGEPADDGGWELTAVGSFPTGIGLEFFLIVGGVDVACYSGVVGSGNVAYTSDGLEADFVSPPVAPGTYDLRVDGSDGSTFTATAAVTVVPRAWASRLYGMRSAHPPPRAAGPYRVEDEVATVGEVGLLGSLLSAIADEIDATSGAMMTITSSDLLAGVSTLPVLGTHRWPNSGLVAVSGRVGAYSGRTATTLTGLVDSETGLAGFPIAIVAGASCLDVSRTRTDLDLVRLSFLVAHAEGVDLDVIGRNYGLNRPAGVGDPTYRLIIMAMAFADAGTVYGITKVLDALLGVGNYELYEDPVTYPSRVFVRSTASSGAAPSGRGYLVGGESQPRTSIVTVDIAHAPSVVYGIWDAADPTRAATNYTSYGFTVYTLAIRPTVLISPTGEWVASDVGGWVTIGGVQTWEILEVYGLTDAYLGRPVETGSTNVGDPDVLTAEYDIFRSWMVGHTVVILTGPGAGTYPVAEVISDYEVRLTGAVFSSSPGVGWTLRPDFPSASSTAAVLRVSVAGLTLTTKVPLPVNVLVDYTTTPSAEIMADAGEAGADPGPLYLYDPAAGVQEVLDLLTVAGVLAIVMP